MVVEKKKGEPTVLAATRKAPNFDGPVTPPGVGAARLHQGIEVCTKMLDDVAYCDICTDMY